MMNRLDNEPVCLNTHSAKQHHQKQKKKMNVVVLTLIFAITSVLQGVTTKEHIVYQDHDVLRTACANDDDCSKTPGTLCVDNLCTCSETSGCKQPEVSPVFRKLGGKCRRTSECFIWNSVCDLGGECVCQNGTIASQNEKACLSVVASLGQPCEENIQCSIASTECLGGTCSCLRGMRGINGECFHMKGLGETCASDEECWNVKRSLCTRGRCTCVKKYVAGASACLDVAAGISAPCTEDVQCAKSLGKGAECVGGFCECKELYQYNKFSTNKCVRDRMLGEECADHQDCHQPGREPSRLECVLGECKCRRPYHQIQGYCIEGAASDIPKAFPLSVLIFISCIVCYNN